jgi:protocatechuate 3,4-dioxygenase beta subunit
MGFFSKLFAFLRRDRIRSRKTRLVRSGFQSMPKVESLEDRTMMSCATISGFVYSDANHNGLFDSGETPIANSPIELLDGNNQVVATTTTDANGNYVFSQDPRINTAPTTATYTANFPSTATNWTASQSLPQFDPSLGTLTSVDVSESTPFTDTIKIENLDTAKATITATVGGTATLSGPSLQGLTANLSVNQTFNAAAFDGKIDFSGPSGETVGPNTTPESNSTTLTAAKDLAPYIGTGTVSFTEATQASSSASGSANLVLSVNTTVSALVTITYHYIPSNCLKPGNYTIVQTSDPAGYKDGEVTAGDVTPIPNSYGSNKIAVTLGGSSLQNNDFAEIPLSGLSGYVYVDANNNGVKDSGEPPISGDTVTLTGSDFLGNAITAVKTITDSNGFYSFEMLAPGNYTITQDEPAGYLDGKDTIGSQGGTAGHDQFTDINLGAAVEGTNNNFGELQPASLSGYVYVDANNNGVKDSGEAGIKGDTVTLSGTDDLGNAVNQTQTTDANGFYNFQNLRPGTYALNQDQPAGYLDGKDTIGTPGGTTAADQFTKINLAAGINGTNNDFGELLPASLSGFVYVDANNNGVKDSGDPGIGGDTVTLTGTDDQGNSVHVTQTTAPDGSYAFTNLRPGTYTLSQDQPPNYTDGKDTIGSQGGTAGADQLTGINLGAGVNGTNNNFSELELASLSGFVYLDANDNGVKDSGEAGLAGSTVTLTGTDVSGNAVNLTQTTGSDGSYSFTNLQPGTYTLKQDQPGAYLDGTDSIGSQGGTAGADQLSNITLTAGTNGVNNNFAELKPASMSGFVYVDQNDNGIKEPGEPAIPGALVLLAGADDHNHPIFDLVQTDANGFFNFTNLRPGTYIIQQGEIPGYLDGRDTIGSQGGMTSHDEFFNIKLGAGVNGTNNDFGELLPGALCGFVYADANNNGIKDAGELSIPGTLLALAGADDLNHPIYAITTTDANGFYCFSNLRPGTYIISEGMTPGYLEGKNTVGNLGGVVVNDQIDTIPLASAQTGTNYDFGELPLASLSGHVYYDANNNGIRDAGDVGLGFQGVTLTGTDDQGHAVVIHQQTDPYGFYQFALLRPGTYTITQDQPSNFADGKDTIGSLGGTTSQDMFAGILVGAAQNGINYDFGEVLPPVAPAVVPQVQAAQSPDLSKFFFLASVGQGIMPA